MMIHFNRLPVLFRTLTFIVLPSMLLLAWGYWRLMQSEPIYQGQLRLSEVTAIKANVDIHFDPQGVPQVKASNDLDAYFAQGYLHASERMWQLELQRRQVNGRLSEIFGQQTVGLDIWMRTLGLSRAAENAWSTLAQDSQAALKAYARGINAWIAQSQTQGRALPAEFMLFDFTPEPWTPLDSLAWQKSFALNLGLNMYDEIHRLQGLKHLSVGQLQTFYPYDPISEYQHWQHDDHDLLTDTQSSAVFDSWGQLATAMEQQLLMGGLHVGSNAWVVSGRHTQSGQAILANDPHLSVQHPSLWYAIGLTGDRLAVNGMSLVGLPGVIVGGNQHISWGVASLMSDQQDLFILRSPVGQPEVYYFDGANTGANTGAKPNVVPYVTRQEVINIRRSSPQFLHNAIKPITVTVRESKLGPVVSDVVNSDGLTLALRWSALDSQDHTITAMLGLQYANHWDEFRQALKSFKNPGIHFSYADRKGNIGSQVAGSLPLRGFGRGILPNDAAIAWQHWQGYVPFEQHPSQYNPDTGFLVNANQSVDSLGDYVISHEWAPMTRASRISARIEQAIDQGDKLTVQAMQDIQTDVVNIEARQLAQLLASSDYQPFLQNAMLELKPPLATVGHLLLQRLAMWSGEFSVDSVEATIYLYWRDALKEQIFSSANQSQRGFVMPVRLNKALLTRTFEGQLLAVLNGENRHWCEPQVCRQMVASSFVSALEALRKQTRSLDIKDWQWGRLHQVQYEHRPFSQMKPLDLVYRHKFAVSGSANTVNAANAVAQREFGYRQTFGAAFRMVYQMGSKPQGYYSLPMGQSGHILSEHYDDQAESFLQGQQFEFVTDSTNRTLSLESDLKPALQSSQSTHKESR